MVSAGLVHNVWLPVLLHSQYMPSRHSQVSSIAQWSNICVPSCGTAAQRVPAY